MNNIFRYGLSSRYEISALFDLANNIDEDKAFTNVQLGGRVRLNQKAHDWIPKLSFQTRIQLRDSLGEENNNLKFVSILAGVFPLPQENSLTINLIANNINKEEYDLTGYTLAWSKNLNSKIDVFVEQFSNRSVEVWNKYWDTGLGYLVHNDLKLDFSVGTDLENDLDSQFVSLGFSWRTL
ncbi:MAG: hypothetical protein CME62_00175 [Halobacteriovoraceae bacterium]|nr:hypothetical protein [Halobacteriovoraceae bacterium]